MPLLLFFYCRCHACQPDDSPSSFPPWSRFYRSHEKLFTASIHASRLLPV